MKQSLETLREWVEECLTLGCLTKWEESFCIDIADQLGRGRNLSERQEEILERIYAEKTG